MRNSESGQAIVDTMVVILIVCSCIFGLMQLALIGTTYISGHDAVQGAIRSRIVNESASNPENTPRWVGRFILLTTQFKKVILLGPGGIYPKVNFFYKRAVTGIKDYENKPIRIVTAKLTYLENLMFAFLFRPVNYSMYDQKTLFYDQYSTKFLPSFLKPRITFSRMIISPDKRFYYKAYPGAEYD